MRKYYWFSEHHDHDRGATSVRFGFRLKYWFNYYPDWLNKFNNRLFGPDNFESKLQPNQNVLVKLTDRTAFERGDLIVVIDLNDRRRFVKQ